MPKPITMTLDLARAASIDAGNASARKAGRTVWNEDDYNACATTFNRLYPVEAPHA